jgi:predicted secreted hydrolase
MRRRGFLAGSVLLLAPRAHAENYPSVLPGRALQFPRDAGAHPAFRNEWWYATAWLASASGATLGVQITFFRNRPQVAETLASRFAPRQLLFAHCALADPRAGRLRYDQRAAREGFGLAEASESTTKVAIGDWSLALEESGYVARIEAREFGLALELSPTQPALLQGEAGFSRKAKLPQYASYYYSEPQLAVKGRIVTGRQRLEVSGTAWLDHEWSSEGLAPEAAGWDWTGLNLDDGGALMAFRMRGRAGGVVWAGGMLRGPDGHARALEPGEVTFSPQRLWRSPRSSVEYPVAMALRAGSEEYLLEPLMDDQELDARASTGTIYWEGAVRASRAGREIGRGYLELTGYGSPLKL